MASKKVGKIGGFMGKTGENKNWLKNKKYRNLTPWI